MSNKCLILRISVRKFVSQRIWNLQCTNRLREQLIKEFNVSIRNICSGKPDCDYVDNANITLNEVCRDGLHLSGKGKCVLINNYLDKVLIFLEVLQYPGKNTH